MISQLISDPIFFAIWVIAILIGLTVHEFSHALIANAMGDRTAKDMGRLTLNPFAHIDWIGFFMLLLVGFGWGKPVPVDPSQMRNPKLGSALSAVAGPLSNLAAIIVFGLLMKGLAVSFGPENMLMMLVGYIIIVNVVLMVFNLIPIPPLDGSKVLLAVLPDRMAQFKQALARYGPFVLILLVVLDGLSGRLFLGTIFSWMVDFVFRLLS